MILKATSRIARWGRLLFLPRFRCSYSLLSDRNVLLNLFLYFSLSIGSTSVYANALELSSDSNVATAGYYHLTWTGSGDTLQLQESTNAAFQSYKVIYQGKDTARVISGKSDGDYYYRLSSTDEYSQNSNVVKVTVAHHPLKNAILFFIAGAIVFISILVLIFQGSRAEKG